MLLPLALSLIVAFTPTASAHHLLATSMDPPPSEWSPEYQINLLENCGGPIDYDADEGFFVAHGLISFRIEDGEFVPSTWPDVPHEGKRAFMSKATAFKLWIDGELQKSSMLVPIDYWSVVDMVLKMKLFIIEHHDGLPAGTYEFVGKWLLDASFFGGEFGTSWPDPAIECASTVTFT